LRQIVLDTETTGLDPQQGHRIIEIGCVEIVQRRLTGAHFHQYIRPDRDVDEGALQVHGISNEFLEDKPEFAAIVDSFLEFVKGAELLIHNAPFDAGFIDAELAKLGPHYGKIKDYCVVTDTLLMARHKHPGQRNSLDALCKRYEVDNTQRQLHGALLDAEILADVYLLMTGGQTDLGLQADENSSSGGVHEIKRIERDALSLPLIKPSADELQAHQDLLSRIHKSSGERCVWLLQDQD